MHPLLKLEGLPHHPRIVAEPAFFLLPEWQRRDAISEAHEAAEAGGADTWARNTMGSVFAQVMRAAVLGDGGKRIGSPAVAPRPVPTSAPDPRDEDPSDDIGGSDNPWG